MQKNKIFLHDTSIGPLMALSVLYTHSAQVLLLVSVNKWNSAYLSEHLWFDPSKCFLAIQLLGKRRIIQREWDSDGGKSLHCFSQKYSVKDVFWFQLTFIISFDISLMVACISGNLISCCMLCMTSVLFARAPATLNVAEKETKFCLATQVTFENNWKQKKGGVDDVQPI